MNYMLDFIVNQFQTQWEFIVQLALSIVLGFAIGYERKIRNKEASLKTHTIVAFGSCLMMIISMYGFKDLNHDVARVAAQIVTGIGFLGAGMIIYRKNTGIHGLTTAAGIWATAAIGMAVGGGLYVVAVCGTIMFILAQIILHINVPFFQKKKFNTFNIQFIQTKDENEKIKELFSADKFQNFTMEKNEEQLVINVTLKSEKTYSTSELTEIINENAFILSIERLEED